MKTYSNTYMIGDLAITTEETDGEIKIIIDDKVWFTLKDSADKMVFLQELENLVVKFRN